MSRPHNSPEDAELQTWTPPEAMPDPEFDRSVTSRLTWTHQIFLLWWRYVEASVLEEMKYRWIFVRLENKCSGNIVVRDDIGVPHCTIPREVFLRSRKFINERYEAYEFQTFWLSSAAFLKFGWMPTKVDNVMIDLRYAIRETLATERCLSGSDPCQKRTNLSDNHS